MDKGVGKERSVFMNHLYNIGEGWRTDLLFEFSLLLFRHKQSGPFQTSAAITTRVVQSTFAQVYLSQVNIFPTLVLQSTLLKILIFCSISYGLKVICSECRELV